MTEEQETMWERLTAEYVLVDVYDPLAVCSDDEWLSKRFVLKKYLGLTDEEIDNVSRY